MIACHPVPSSRRGRASGSPRAGAGLVDEFFRRVNLDVKAREYRALFAWHRMAGPRLSRRTRAETVRGTTLFVRAATAPWANELSYLRAGLLERLRDTPGGEWIEELRFSIGPLDALPCWDDEPPPPPSPPAPGLVPLDGSAMAEALLKVTDPELRMALAELFARAAVAR